LKQQFFEHYSETCHGLFLMTHEFLAYRPLSVDHQ